MTWLDTVKAERARAQRRERMGCLAWVILWALCAGLALAL